MDSQGKEKPMNKNARATTVDHLLTPEGAREDSGSSPVLVTNFPPWDGSPFFRRLSWLVFVTAKTKLAALAEAWADQG